MDMKGHSRRLFPNLSTNALHRNINPVSEAQSKNFGRARNTDYTEDRVSDRSQSRSQKVYEGSQIEEELPIIQDYQNNSYQKQYPMGNMMMKTISSKEEKTIELRERLKNIHHFYRIRIEEERNKNLQRNEIFIGIIEELQKNHNDKIINIQRTLQQIDEDKKDIGYVDNRMGTIKNTIEEILAQSKQLKSMNQSMEKDIIHKEHILKEKEAQYIGMKDEIDELRNKLQQFQRLRLKENKRNKEMVDIIDGAFE